MSKPYGDTTRPYHMARNLVKLGHEVLHICAKPPIQKDDIIYLPQQYYSGKTKYKKFIYLFKICKDFSPDIIYSHQLSNSNMGIILKYLLNRPLVYDAHSSAFLEMATYPSVSLMRKKRLILNEDIILKIADKIIVVSNELLRFIVDKYDIPYKKINIVKNGVDANLFKPEKPYINLKRKWGISDKEKIVIFTNPRIPSFPSNEMALHYFFNMIPDIEKKILDVKFLILGGGQQPAPPSKNVIYTGFVEDLPAYLNLADVCIAPFPPEAVCGGTRNKVNEYFACGKAVISTKEGVRGFDDAIPDKHYLLAEDKKDFIDKLIYCLSNHEEAEKIGRNARELSLNYDWNVLSRNVEKIFIEMLD
jgi:glycosyltransferase involved in cell wall biosynthesis